MKIFEEEDILMLEIFIVGKVVLKHDIEWLPKMDLERDLVIGRGFSKVNKDLPLVSPSNAAG